jgi:N-acetylneuraminic acid mutarotase
MMTLLISGITRSLFMSMIVLSSLVAGTQTGFTAQGDGPCIPQQATPEASPSTAAEPDAWTELPPMPRPRSELGAASISDTIFVAGGFGGPAMLDCFHAGTGTWAVGADLPAGVHHPGVTALDGRIYVAGGYTETGDTDALWAYDPGADAWEERAPMPTSRGALGLAVVDGRIYAVGGALDHLGGPVTGAVEVYDPATDTWEERAPLPTPREHLAVAAGDGQVYAIGGRANGDEGDQFAAAVEAYDPATDTWEALPPLPTPRGGFAGVFVAGQVVVLGGERGTTAFDTVEAYDPTNQTWTGLPPMPTARHGVAVTAIGDTVYALAGSTRARAAESTGANEALTIAPPT